MPDAQGNPDTQDIFQHWAVVRNQARALMNAARDMEKMGDDMTPAGKASRMQAMKTVHPNCPVCQAFEGNHPAENPTVEVQPEPEPEPEALHTPGRYAVATFGAPSVPEAPPKKRRSMRGKGTRAKQAPPTPEEPPKSGLMGRFFKKKDN